jgi:hypothetical protein
VTGNTVFSFEKFRVGIRPFLSNMWNCLCRGIGCFAALVTGCINDLSQKNRKIY